LNIANPNVTPMMAQFLEIKETVPDALLFYRMGDFYEMFFDDAVQAAAALDIALTKRGKHLGQDIPMCGVPAHSAENYLLTLIRKGFRVAVCDQMEDPAEAKKRGSKSVVRREVVRLVTPGTLTEDSLLDARKHNYLASFVDVRGEAAFAWADVSTGDFFVQPCPRVALAPQLARLAPRELLVPDRMESALRELAEDAGVALTPLAGASFDSTSAQHRLSGLYKVASLDGFGAFSLPEFAALGAIVDYLELTQKGKLPLLRRPERELRDGIMQIDGATRRNLELTTTIGGGRDGSLLAVMDKTATGPGARLLEKRIHSPSTDVETIEGRLDAVAFYVEAPGLQDTLRQALRKTPDIDRALSRLALERGGPRDLGSVRTGLSQASEIAAMHTDTTVPTLLADTLGTLTGFETVRDRLDAALNDDLPLLLRDGGFVRPGYHAELDEARKLRDDGRKVISSLQSKYAEAAGITALKIKHNNVLGYFIETPATHATKMMNPPLSDAFIHRQTTANAVRFTTVELSGMETKILNAGARALELEKEIFGKLRAAILDFAVAIGQAARALAEIDLWSSLAELAIGSGWTRPAVTNDRRFLIEAGRHPVVEAALRRQGDAPFVANDSDLSPDGTEAARIWLLTGPNMAGKSTYLRQNALIALLAQIGSFVPADRAEIGIVSQLFSRVGASDDLARGRSTFMVEMVETAAILNQADANALVILDEIGRGTATYDGLSIAWATLEHLHETNRCRALFATHYHELTHLSSRLDGLSNATVSVREWEGDVIFLHEVREGSADRSYGVQVAKLAGLPESVVARARTVLDSLERADREGGGKAKSLVDDLPLFSAQPVPAAPTPVEHGRVEEALQQLRPDELSPLEALTALYDLKRLMTPD